MLIKSYTTAIETYLNQLSFKQEPKNLYDPITYILNIGGKRIRPSLTLMACELFGTPYVRALDAALCVEMFHNFSLIHDDIMDQAPLRRGHKTVHTKWNLNTGILSGDALLILACQQLNKYEGIVFKKLNELFYETALEVCEGQQYDFNFEQSFEVSVADYLNMIRLKTAVLLAAALKFGAIVAEANEEDMNQIYAFGLNLGMAFQLQDDYLDVFGTDNFGKQPAGDIISNKKTYMLLKALDLVDSTDRNTIVHWYSKTEYSTEKIKIIRQLFKKVKVDILIQEEIAKYTQLATENVRQLNIAEGKKEQLNKFATDLMQRKI
ncbi:polyprenyl synthetase family protein [Flavobacteriaceae bacterium F08102]|nr:polyprenyl synthetase family protein [Flavobacteriaceae bacterium F08102]